MRRAAILTGKIIAGLAFAACPLITHAAVASGSWGAAAVAAVALQATLLLTLLLWQPFRGRGWLAAAAAAALVAVVLVYSHAASSDPVALAGAPHAIIYIGLLAVFGASLLPGREPIVTAVARRMRGTLPAGVAAYTRRVTAAWCVFFAAQLVASFILFHAAPAEVWSVFVNFLNLPLLVLMFAGEYLWRRRRFPHLRHAGLVAALRALRLGAPAFPKPPAFPKSVDPG